MRSNDELRKELCDRICTLMLVIFGPLKGKSMEELPEDLKESIEKLTG